MSVFVDTNLLIYSAIEDPAEREKTRRADALLTRQEWACSAQVLQEFYTQVPRPNRPNRLSHDVASVYVSRFAQKRVQPTTAGLVQAAITASWRYRISYWDAAIVEAARLLDCEFLATEDLQHGQNFDGVRVYNPFL